MFEIGRLDNYVQGFPADIQLQISGILRRQQDVKTGVLTGELAEQLLPKDFSMLLIKTTVPLSFQNMIGDELHDQTKTYLEKILQEKNSSLNRLMLHLPGT